MNEDLIKIKKQLLEDINLILKEYPNCNRKEIANIMNHDKEIVKYNSSNTITFIVQDGVLLLPKVAYQIFPLLKKYENYGTKLNSNRNIADYLDTNTTYKEYITHLIESGMSVYDYFEESLLHEAMHICGSQGGYPLEEGINELKTRELAQKYNIKIAAYGYSKEVKMAKKMQEIIGKETMDELTFIPKYERVKILTDKLGNEVGELYSQISTEMMKKSNDYYKKLSQISNPFEKANLYDNIDYTELYQTLDNYTNKKIIQTHKDYKNY